MNFGIVEKKFLKTTIRRYLFMRRLPFRCKIYSVLLIRDLLLLAKIKFVFSTPYRQKNCLSNLSAAFVSRK